MNAAMLLLVVATLPADVPRSCPPMRALPAASNRPLGPGPHFYADAAKGDDASDGSRDKPWKTIALALKRLKPGDTLLLRGGVFYEALDITVSGAAGKPLSVRSYPGELAVIDGGFREFTEAPAANWQPVADGAKGEFQSVKTYDDLGKMVAGHFADSMVPLHAYRNLVDLSSDNPYWTIKNKLEAESGVYCGPGQWYDARSERLHVRLQPTRLAVLGDDNYRGETDPRKLQLLVGGPKPTVRLNGARHLRFQDLVLRGSTHATLRLENAEHIELDGLTIYGGSPALWARSTAGLKLMRCAIRGISAPWSFRTSHKYRGIAAYVLMSHPSSPPNRDWEIAYSELTDCHDGPFLGSVNGLKLHHCLVDNFNDDGIYITACGIGGDVHIYQNLISRCLHAFSLYGSFKPGSGVHIYRNVIDLRPPVYTGQPAGVDDPAFKNGMPGRGRLCGDHGSPIWEPVRFYHNTVVFSDAFRDYYGAGWGGHNTKTTRRVFNNIFVQLAGNPGLNFDSAGEDLQVDGNLLWNLRDGPPKGDYFARFRNSALFAASRKHYADGWTAHDRFADPRSTRLVADWRVPLDVRLLLESPAVNNGIILPADWSDPLREKDAGKPDIGALPLGAGPLEIGPRR